MHFGLSSSILCLCFLASGSAPAQVAGTPEPPTTAATPSTNPPALPPPDLKDPVALLAAARATNGLAGVDLKPWHLKANYDILDARSKIVATGVFEEWWASKDKWKRSYTGAHYTGTEYHLPDGYAHEGSPWTEVPWPESLLAEKVLDPLGQVDAPQTTSDATHTSHIVARPPLAIHPVGLTKPPLSCVLPASQHGEVSLTDPRDYCFEPGTTELRVSILTGLLSAYNKLAKFQQHTISLESSMSVNNHGLLNVHVVSLTGLLPNDERTFTPTAPLVHGDASLHIPGVVLAGKKISGADVIYPEVAKFHRDRGVVIVGATINQQGHIENARVLEAPTSELGASSLAAIRTWVYQPYLLNGQPVSVETTVNVVFSMGN